ncbi:MAG: peptide chain release factor 1 [SAR202 cluster bacterium]|nr:peptide chain release factor 1 [SAR202 cluster bacterium]
MRPALREKLRAIAARHTEIEHLMADPSLGSDGARRKKLGREYNELQRVVELTAQYDRREAELASLQGMIKGEADPEVLEMARAEASEVDKALEELDRQIEIALIPRDVTVGAEAIVEIRGGAGGEEASLFAGELLRMYQRYAESKGWKAQIVNMNDTGIGGIKEVVFEVHGDDAYSRLKYESGVHRVQRVPATESSGRIHTSTATVAVLPKPEEIDIEIKAEDLRIDVYHSSGHGGQNVQKVATAIRITHLPTGIVATSQRERSQLQNRTLAMEVLRARLWDMELQKQQASISAERRTQVGSGERSEKIRTYNFPQSRVTDHRIGFTSHNLQQILEGELDEMIDALLAEEQARKLAALERSAQPARS